MSEPFTTIKISEETAHDIMKQFEAVRSLVAGMIAALEFDFYVDHEDTSEVHGAGHFVIDKKSVLATFGRVIWDEFVILHHFLSKLEKNNDEH